MPHRTSQIVPSFRENERLVIAKVEQCTHSALGIRFYPALKGTSRPVFVWDETIQACSTSERERPASLKMVSFKMPYKHTVEQWRKNNGKIGIREYLTNPPFGSLNVALLYWDKSSSFHIEPVMIKSDKGLRVGDLRTAVRDVLETFPDSRQPERLVGINVMLADEEELQS